MITFITKYLRQKGGRLYAIFVDFEKAFDRINRSMLWNKLNTLNVSSKMVKMLRSIYSEVKYCVKSDSELTNYFDCMNGVRQGCANSPILFCFFLNDLNDFVTVDSHGIDLNMCKLFLLLFADDLGDNFIQICHLGRYIVGYTVGNFVLRRRVSGAVKHDFRTYIRRYTSPNDKFEYGYPHSNVLFNMYTSKQGICLKNISCMSDVYSLR